MPSDWFNKRADLPAARQAVWAGQPEDAGRKKGGDGVCFVSCESQKAKLVS